MGRKQIHVPMPSPRKVHSFRFPALNGGLNLRDAEINLKDNESSEIVNLWWKDGLLQSRPGQERVTFGYDDNTGDNRSFDASDVVYAAAPFQEGVVVHISSSLYTWHGSLQALRIVDGDGDVATTVPRKAGTFFRFGKELFYKNAGGFYRLTHNGSHSQTESPLTLSRVTEDAFVPTILLNANPATGSGDIYQPENALSPRKRVSYNAATFPETVVKTANGTERIFLLGYAKAADNLQGVQSVYIDDAFLESALYTVDTITGSVIFNAAPKKDAVITFTLDIGRIEYHLPVFPVDAVTEVKVDGILWNPGQDYTVDAPAGVVTFKTAPQVTDPPTNNTVEITYSKTNAEAESAVMNCPYASVYGTGRELCAVVGGGSSAPNVFYWSGTTQYGIDITYWPVLNSNVADSDITGFGKQYDQMFVFQKDKIGKLDYSTESVNGRDTVSLAYSGVNDAIGCDLPQSVQLIENNLTFANTFGGVYQILSASAAYENNVQCISDKINGSNICPGLLSDLTIAGSGPVRSLDDGKRYWLTVNNHVWLWDYSISGNADPVWFYFTDIDAHALSMRDKSPCLFRNAQWDPDDSDSYDISAVKLSGEGFGDFDAPIRKVCQLPARNFGGYDRLKDVLTLIISLRADTPSNVNVIYETDYETRADLISLHNDGHDRLTDRNLEVRDLSVPRHAAVFRREPGCKHVRHFSLRLENNEYGQNLAPYSIEVQYRFTGRER